MESSQEQLVEAVVQNNSLYIAGTDKTPGVPLVNIPDDDTVIELTNSSQECKVIPKKEPKAQFKNEDDESVEDDNNPDKDQFENIVHTERLKSTTNNDGLQQSNCNIRPLQVT